MARIPSPEQMLIEALQSLGLDRPPTKHIDQFTELGFPLPRQKAFLEELVENIFSALEMDEQARKDAWSNLREWCTFDVATAAHTWTHGASQRQVLWHLLAYAWVPGLARRLAFWSLAGARRGVPFDAGMPGGAFWFLPDWNPSGETVRLPMEGVLAWLLDLLGDQSLEHVAGALQREQAARKNMHALRTLQGWRLEGRLPQSAKVIDELFHDDAALDFLGSFDLPPKDEEQLGAAIAFVRRKGLTPELLEHEIPIRATRLQAILEGGAPAEDNHAFVLALAIRYAAPSMRSVRQRLRVARMSQDAYRRLQAALCGPGMAPGCAEPSQNRVLPLLALFQTVYNLTIQSFGQGETDEERDAWFESKIAPWDRADLLLSIMPSARGFGYRMLGARLTRRFMALGADESLPDLVPFGDEDQASATVLARIRMLEAEADENARIDRLRLAASLPPPALGQALDAERSYLVVSQIAVDGALSAHARLLAAARMHALAGSPTQRAGAQVAELALLADGPVPARSEDAQARIDSLLRELGVTDTQGPFRAPFLRFRARHRLALNDFEGAANDLREALQACLSHNHGPLREEIAKEGLATEVAMRGWVRKTQDFWYRHLVPPTWMTDARPSFEDMAVGCDDFFWAQLYQPYEGTEARTGQATTVLKDLLAESVALIQGADMHRLGSWLLQHEKQLRNLGMKDVRKDNLLLLWMKLLSNMERIVRRPVSLGALRPARAAPGTAMRRAIGVLVELWPEQAKAVDFKQQTPLMIAADDGDAGLAALLASRSDIDAQDYLGRTALHAAVTGGSVRCVGIVLDRNPDVSKVTVDEGQTALHTAVRFGNLKAVSLIADAFPCRLDTRNHAGKTPLETARALLADYDGWREFMRRQNRRSGSMEDFQAIVSRLDALSA
ncbi:ankyrin repeat domain-containing protein [Massilia sp. HP4]|uniref:ankyrin repeat domain-containing protein n=1 Tax=Massilia sp. HP4 TaxID=2562316 RepID=UPI0010C0253B|nr:ankyrin repeat domain-containing protein [Massilia sp. HP4]